MRWYGLGAVDEGFLQIGGNGDFGISSQESIHVPISRHVS